PDVYLRAVPAVLRALARVLLAGEYRRARRILGSATAIVAVSEGYLQWGLRHAGRARAPGDGVFPHGYPVERFAPEELAGARRQLEGVGVDPHLSVCSFVGTFGRSYDLSPVIATARAMLERGHLRAQFVFAGEGELGRRRLARVETGFRADIVYPALVRRLESLVFGTR